MRNLQEYTPGRIFDMTGEVVLLTGAAGGIGRALAAGFIAAGAEVAMTDLTEEGLQAAAAALPSVRHRTYTTDLSVVANCESLVTNVVDDFRRITVLVNCAAINKRKSILEVTEEDYDQIVGVNQKAPFFLSKLVAAHMIEHAEAHPDSEANRAMLHITSINSKYGLYGVGPYGMTKAALEQHVKVQAEEWGEYGIRVNAIAPGFFDTPLTIPIQKDPVRMAWIRDHTPLGRLGRPAELVPAAQLLASRAGSFISGTVLEVHGGFPESNWMQQKSRS